MRINGREKETDNWVPPPPPCLTISQPEPNPTPNQGLFLLLAFKACESAGVSAPNTQLLSTFLPAVVIVSMAPKLA